MRLSWDDRPIVDDGVDRGAVYVPGHSASWNGLINVDEQPMGGDSSSVYFDGVKTLDYLTSEDFGLSISAYTYPEEIEEYERDCRQFGFTYRTGKSRLSHLVYNSTIFSGNKTRTSMSQTPTPTTMTWSLYAQPEIVPNGKPTSHLVVDNTVADPRAMADFESVLYGSPSTNPRFPGVDEVIAIFAGYATLVVIDHGDGTWTATGPDEAIQMIDPTTFSITWPSAIYVSDDKYKISSL